MLASTPCVLFLLTFAAVDPVEHWDEAKVAAAAFMDLSPLDEDDRKWYGGTLAVAAARIGALDRAKELALATEQEDCAAVVALALLEDGRTNDGLEILKADVETPSARHWVLQEALLSGRIGSAEQHGRLTEELSPDGRLILRIRHFLRRVQLGSDDPTKPEIAKERDAIEAEVAKSTSSDIRCCAVTYFWATGQRRQVDEFIKNAATDKHRWELSTAIEIGRHLGRLDLAAYLASRDPDQILRGFRLRDVLNSMIRDGTPAQVDFVLEQMQSSPSKDESDDQQLKVIAHAVARRYDESIDSFRRCNEFSRLDELFDAAEIALNRRDLPAVKAMCDEARKSIPPFQFLVSHASRAVWMAQISRLDRLSGRQAEAEKWLESAIQSAKEFEGNDEHEFIFDTESIWVPIAESVEGASETKTIAQVWTRFDDAFQKCRGMAGAKIGGMAGLAVHQRMESVFLQRHGPKAFLEFHVADDASHPDSEGEGTGEEFLAFEIAAACDRFDELVSLAQLVRDEKERLKFLIYGLDAFVESHPRFQKMPVRNPEEVPLPRPMI